MTSSWLQDTASVNRQEWLLSGRKHTEWLPPSCSKPLAQPEVALLSSENALPPPCSPASAAHSSHPPCPVIEIRCRQQKQERGRGRREKEQRDGGRKWNILQIQLANCYHVHLRVSWREIEKKDGENYVLNKSKRKTFPHLSPRSLKTSISTVIYCRQTGSGDWGDDIWWWIVKKRINMSGDWQAQGVKPPSRGN